MCAGTLEIEPEDFISQWDHRDWVNAYTVHTHVKQAQREGHSDLLTYVSDDQVPSWLLTQLDGHGVRPNDDLPGPGLFTYTGDLDWLALAEQRPDQVDLDINYDSAPTLKQIRAVASAARGMGAEVWFYAELFTNAATHGISVNLEAMATGGGTEAAHSLAGLRVKVREAYGVNLTTSGSPVGFPQDFLAWEWF